jgi:23S rRNA (cytosine1962-C5)-methyltransferase
MANRPQLVLKPERERSLERRHPWVFSGAVAEVRGDPQPGATIDIVSARGDFLAQAAYSPLSQIRARVWTWLQDETVDAAFLRARQQAAIASRGDIEKNSDAYRLVHAESDGLPGIIADKYGDVVVLQCLNWGAEAWRAELALALADLTGCAIYERSDADVRKLEGLPERVGWLHGQANLTAHSIREHGLEYKVDLAGGHKTGFYLDQRDNRLTLRELAAGRETLDCFSYTGGFTMNALKGGAKKVTLVEDSADALAAARANLERNGLDVDAAEFINGDAFQVLRRFRDEARKYDLIVLDPPKFAPTKMQAERAARGYKDINLLALKLLRPGGLLATFSCSGGVDALLFQKIVAGAALDAAIDARILGRFSQGRDHPVALNFPEGEYLKGLLIQVG